MKGKENKDLSKLKCFNYGEYGHYSMKFPKKKKGDNGKKGKELTGAATTFVLDDLSIKFEEDFSIVSHFFEDAINETA